MILLGTLPPLLQVPEIKGECCAEIQEVIRLLTGKEMKPLISSKVRETGELIPSQDEFFGIVSEIKWGFIEKDLLSLAAKIEAVYRQKLKDLDFNDMTHSVLYQIVEIPWTLEEPAQGNSSIRYRIFTKRDICIKGDL